MVQAVLEGVAFAIRDSFEVAKSLGIEIPRSNICGGGAKSPLWRKIFANVLGIPLDMVKTEQGPGYGAAMLAMVGCGKFKTVQEAADKLVETAVALHKQVKSGEARLSAETTLFVRDWLQSHIPNVDKPYGPYLNQRGVR